MCADRRFMFSVRLPVISRGQQLRFGGVKIIHGISTVWEGAVLPLCRSTAHVTQFPGCHLGDGPHKGRHGREEAESSQALLGLPGERQWWLIQDASWRSRQSQGCFPQRQTCWGHWHGEEEAGEVGRQQGIHPRSWGAGIAGSARRQHLLHSGQSSRIGYSDLRSQL